MRYCFAAMVAVFIAVTALPMLGYPVYVHDRTKKAKKHKVPKHRSVQR
jgi:hypothetical protein